MPSMFRILFDMCFCYPPLSKWATVLLFPSDLREDRKLFLPYNAKYMGWVSVWRIGSEVPVLSPDLEDMSGRNRNMVSKQNKPNYSQQTGWWTSWKLLVYCLSWCYDKVQFVHFFRLFFLMRATNSTVHTSASPFSCWNLFSHKHSCSFWLYVLFF